MKHDGNNIYIDEEGWVDTDLDRLGIVFYSVADVFSRYLFKLNLPQKNALCGTIVNALNAVNGMIAVI